MANNENPSCCEKFKTMIGGQALIEGIMMRGPEKDAIVCRTKDGLDLQVSDRKLPKEGSPLKWPFVRGVVNFFDSQVTGVKALMRSADLAPEEYQEEPSKLDQWLEKKLGNEKFQQMIVGIAVFMGLAMSVGLFMLLPMLIGNIFQQLYSTVDSIVVGKYVGDNALASVGSATPIYNLLLVLFMGISVGIGIMVSQYHGARKKDELSKAIGSVSTIML